jgi:ATP phosphoribosyltransferase regulatory subunit
MVAESAQRFEALENQARLLLSLFGRAGYEHVAPAIIQPADLFLDKIGEAIRSRTYVFTDLAGDELCLRPDLTVPVSRLYLERHPDADVEARYCYNGPAFRFHADGPSHNRPREFRQAGIECFGASDAEAVDVEVVLVTLEAVRRAGLKRWRLHLGDIALFYALLDALALPERWLFRLRHYFWRPPAFHALLARLSKGGGPNCNSSNSALAGQLVGLSIEDAQQTVAVYLRKEDLPLAGNRSLTEITSRLLEHAADLRADPLPPDVATVIDQYLTISGPPKQVAQQLEIVAKGAGIEFGPAVDTFLQRLERLEASGIDISASTFATEFGHSLEYYSGFVFEVKAISSEDEGPIAGGGRYDGFLLHLGAPCDVPAAGSAIHTERLLAAVERAS